MKIEQITALKDAGFTAEQIVALAPILTDEAPKPETNPEPKPETKPETNPEPKPEKTPMEEMMSTMQKQFEDMVTALQGVMINGSRQTETEMTAADVAASILDPGRNRGKK